MNKFIHFNIRLRQNASLKQRKKYQSRTVVVAPIEASAVNDLAHKMLHLNAKGVELTTVLNVGVTFLSLKDRYCKKEGREQAIQRMAPVTLKVNQVELNETHVTVELAEYKGVIIYLRLNKATGNVMVIGTLNVEG